MMEIGRRRERFMRDDMPVRLGGIAANLARIASFAPNPANRQAVLDLIEESKWFIEWAAPSADLDTAARLIEMQVSLSLMENHLRGNSIDTAMLVKATSEWRDEVLEMSGLFE